MKMEFHSLREKLFFAFRQFWCRAVPFQVFRDAGHGTLEQRSANYRYNRSRRNLLPPYIAKWLAISIGMMTLLQLLSSLMLATESGSAHHLCATMFCMSAGIGFAFSCIVLAVLTFSYLFLTYIKR